MWFLAISTTAKAWAIYLPFDEIAPVLFFIEIRRIRTAANA
jgi:hypothetical protein